MGKFYPIKIHNLRVVYSPEWDTGEGGFCGWAERELPVTDMPDQLAELLQAWIEVVESCFQEHADA